MAERPLVLETRTVETTLELRDAESTAPVIEGYAATFKEYDMGAFREVIDPGAFTRTLGAKPDVPLLVEHAGTALARTRSGTLDLEVDSTGLHMRAQLDPAAPRVQDLMSSLRRGDMDQMSFGFRVPKGGDTWDNDLRTLQNIELNGGDVSVVTYPANSDTSVALRARDERDAQCVFAAHIVEEMRSGHPISDEDMTRLRALLTDLTGSPDAAPVPVVAAPAELTPVLVEVPAGRSLRSALAFAVALDL